MIQVKDFRKTFFVGLRRRRSEAAKAITFEVEPREVFGFLGPNGAGKTTTIKALLGLIWADGGELKLLGQDVRSMAWRNEVGYMPEHPTFYDFLTGLEMVSWFGRLSGLSSIDATKRAETLLHRVGLSHAMKRRLRGYSKGMLQRAGLAQALVGSPKLLILDEPMTGLDPIGRRDMRELILELRDEGRTIFYSTHILPDIEMTCDRVSIINQGVTKQTGRLQDILTETIRGISVVVQNLSPEKLAAARKQHPGSTDADGALQIEFDEIEKARAFANEMIREGGELVRFEPHRDDLETIFMRSLGSESAVATDSTTTEENRS